MSLELGIGFLVGYIIGKVVEKQRWIEKYVDKEQITDEKEKTE